MIVIEGYLDAMRRYADFSGRSTRSEYWYFSLVVFGLSIVSFIGMIALSETPLGIIFIIVLALVVLIHMIPSISVTVRRLHDFDSSGWWYLVSLVLGTIFFVAVGCIASTNGYNKYGPAKGNMRRILDTFT